MSNVEVMYPACRELCVERSILKKTEQSDSTFDICHAALSHMLHMDSYGVSRLVFGRDLKF